MVEPTYLQAISMTKLAEYDQSRTDLPIRKYVLIANLLRDSNREQQWFEACLDDLEDDQDEVMSDIEDDVMSEQETKLYEESKEQHKKCNSMTPLFYNFANGVGFIMCTSASLS
jgi:hypothetical protein